MTTSACAVDIQAIVPYDTRPMSASIRNTSIFVRGMVVRLDDFPDLLAA